MKLQEGTSTLNYNCILNLPVECQQTQYLLQLETNSREALPGSSPNFTEALPGSSQNISDAADPSPRGTLAYRSLKTAIQITLNCLGDDPNTPPSTDDVLWQLQYSIQVQEGWNSSRNLDTKI